jgi:hypothetical protein
MYIWKREGVEEETVGYRRFPQARYASHRLRPLRGL